MSHRSHSITFLNSERLSNMLKSKLLFLGFILLFAANSIAQNFNDSLIIHYRSLSVRAETDSLKYVYSDSLRSEIKLFLNQPNSFEQPLTNIPYLGDIFSPDGAFRMVTWNLSLINGTYDYFCFIQKKNEQGPIPYSWFELTDRHKEITRPESRSLKKENWYGALYYSIIPFKKDKKNMYVLLGWEGHNKFSNKKILECLYSVSYTHLTLPTTPYV